jgi:outer membrane protein, multidrug efflux system
MPMNAHPSRPRLRTRPRAGRLPVAALLTALVLLGPDRARAERAVAIDEAYTLALRNSPSLHVLKERVVQAEAARSKVWSTLKPTASFQGTYTHYNQEIAVDFASSFAEVVKQIFPTTTLPDVPAQPIVIQKQDQFAFGLGAKLPIFYGPAYPRLGMAQRGIDIARKTELRSTQEFLLTVAQAYYSVVSQKEVVKAVENKLDVDRKHLTSTKAQFEVGNAPRATMLRADLVTTQDEQTLRTEKNTLASLKRQLGILLGVEDSIDATRPVEPGVPEGSERGMVDLALRTRIDFATTDLSLRLARETKNAVWWQFLPTLDLQWAWRWTEASGFAGQQNSWYLMFTLNVPIYDGGARYADLHDAESKLREAGENRRALSQQIETQVVKCRADMDSANAAAISSAKAVSLAKDTATDMEASFEVGAATQLDVLDSTQRLLEAELTLTRALFARDLARLALANVLGAFDPMKK